MPSEPESKNLFPITLIYLLITGIITLLSNIDEGDLLNLMKLNYKKIFFKYELWRLITTFFYIGKPSPKLIFNYFLYYKRMRATEKKFIKNKKLSEFIMMLIYLMILIHICNFIGYFIFNIKYNSFLSNQLMFSLILINSKRSPDKMFKFYLVRIPNKYVPYFLFAIKTIKNKKIAKNIVSFIPGFAYYYLKDILPKMDNNIDILVTPKFLEKFCKNYFYNKYNSKKKKIKNKEKEKTDNDNSQQKEDDIINRNANNEKIKYE